MNNPCPMTDAAREAVTINLPETTMKTEIPAVSQCLLADGKLVIWTSDDHTWRIVLNDMTSRQMLDLWCPPKDSPYYDQERMRFNFGMRADVKPVSGGIAAAACDDKWPYSKVMKWAMTSTGVKRWQHTGGMSIGPLKLTPADDAPYVYLTWSHRNEHGYTQVSCCPAAKGDKCEVQEVI